MHTQHTHGTKLEDYDLCVCPNCKGTGIVEDDRDVNGVAVMREHDCGLCDGVGDIHLTPAAASLLALGGYDNDENIAMCHCGLVNLTGNGCLLCSRVAAAADDRDRKRGI